eukprot:15326696-Ditylum_brightwellii.AAC.1
MKQTVQHQKQMRRLKQIRKRSLTMIREMGQRIQITHTAMPRKKIMTLAHWNPKLITTAKYIVYMNFNGITLKNSGTEFLDKPTVLKGIGSSIISDAELNINQRKGDLLDRAKNVILQV